MIILLNSIVQKNIIQNLITIFVRHTSHFTISGAKIQKKMYIRKKKNETPKNICIYEKELVTLQRICEVKSFNL